MNKPITGIDFLGAGDFYTKVNDETTMKLGELGWPNPAIDKANQPQRTWVGLTVKELMEIEEKWEGSPDWATFVEAAKYIEAKLQEKNA